ncbi:MAG TPA: hypothetical protein VF759_09400 [Allosphingosinicella sp.]
MRTGLPCGTPVAVSGAHLRVGLLDFTPVPRRYRHDGWTPEWQKAFIAALAVTGCVERAARMVNIARLGGRRRRDLSQ